MDGRRVHLHRADPSQDAPPDAPTQLLLHGMAGSGTAWLDVIPSLVPLGPVVAPDLPGSIFGETTTHRTYEATLEPSVAFLDRLTAALGVESVALHGMSTGGMAGLRFAAEHPGRTHRLIIANSLLPTPMRRLERLGWQTLGRLAATAGPAVARALIRLWGRRLVERRGRARRWCGTACGDRARPR